MTYVIAFHETRHSLFLGEKLIGGLPQAKVFDSLAAAEGYHRRGGLSRKTWLILDIEQAQTLVTLAAL